MTPFLDEVVKKHTGSAKACREYRTERNLGVYSSSDGLVVIRYSDRCVSRGIRSPPTRPQSRGIYTATARHDPVSLTV